MQFDMSELRKLAVAIEATSTKAPKKARAVVKRGAENVKKQMRSEAAASSWFGQIAPTITYDMLGGGDLGGTVIEAEIGPNTHFKAARIENIAYFGSSRAGGGTVPDPRGAGEAELPNLEKYLGDLGEAIE